MSEDKLTPAQRARFKREARAIADMLNSDDPMERDAVLQALAEVAADHNMSPEQILEGIQKENAKHQR